MVKAAKQTLVQPAQFHAPCCIHIQQPNRYFADFGNTYDFAAFLLKMLAPNMNPWGEQSDNLAGLWAGPRTNIQMERRFPTRPLCPKTSLMSQWATLFPPGRDEAWGAR